MEEETMKKIITREVMEQTLLSSFHGALDKLEFIWNEIGINDESRQERMKVVLDYLHTLLSELVGDEEKLHKDLKERVEKYGKELQDLCNDLGLCYEPEEKLCILQLERELRTKLDELTRERHLRMKSLKRLRESERKLCAVLDMPAHQLSSSGVPTKQDLYEMEQHIQMLKNEKEHRFQEFCSTKRELTTIMEITELGPETSFEREVICHDDEEFILSQENIQELKKLVEKVHAKKKEFEQQSIVLRGRLETLWDRLNVEKTERDKFLSKHTGYKPSVINSIKKEIQRCEEIKKQNVLQYINKLKDELVSWWDRCFVSENKRKECSYFSNDNFTEELLDMLDAEVQKMKRFYEENEEIFIKIARRQEFWDRMIEFERKASDPNRFNNRGGGLLQEEKERKKLLKELPKLEKELMEEIDLWEQQNKQEFLVNGENFEEFVKEQWELHRKEKENIKMERQKQRAKQLEEEIISGSRPVITPGKRRLISTTPSKTPNKLRRMNTGVSTLGTPGMISRMGSSVAIFHSPALKSKNSGKTPSRRSPRLTPFKRNMPFHGVLVERHDNVIPATEASHITPPSVSVASYSEFTKELNKKARDHCRSSVVSPAVKKIRGSKLSSPHQKSRRSNPRRVAANNSSRYLLRNHSKLEPARGNLGLPFLI